MPKSIIANTSPIFYLYRLRLLEILEKLYGIITIPSAVIDELEEGKMQGEDVPNIQEYPWIQIEQVKVPEFLKLITDLAPGEAQVLAFSNRKTEFAYDS